YRPRAWQWDDRRDREVARAEGAKGCEDDERAEGLDCRDIGKDCDLIAENTHGTAVPAKAGRGLDLRWPFLRRSKRATTLARVGETDGRPDSMAHFDVVVCGLGAMGSAAVEHLARRGKRVLGLERYAPGHDRGSSHGLTRIIRLGYFEHPSYVPLLRHAYKLWHELEQTIGRGLLHVTGIAEIGPPDSALVRGTLACAHLHASRHELLAAPELMRRFPAFRVPQDYVAIVQPDGGILEVEPAARIRDRRRGGHSHGRSGASG